MRWSMTFIPTLRDVPAYAETPAHRFLIRGAFIRQLSAGIYTCLPLGQRTLLKVTSIVREEMNAAGAQEFSLPSGGIRRDNAGHISDGDDASLLEARAGDSRNGAIHQDLFTEIVRRELRSYRDLPQVWHCMRLSFPDIGRSKPGLFRPRQLVVNDSCSFDRDQPGLERSYRVHRDVYSRILARCGLKFVTVEAGAGEEQISQLQEFLVPMENGGDLVVSCSCGYAASLERARSRIARIEDLRALGEPREVHTPGRKTIAEIADFLNVPATHQVKSLVYVADDKPCLLLLRGDHQLNEAKAVSALGTRPVRPALPEEIHTAFEADAGSLGPVGITGIPVYADLALQGRGNLTCGANRNDYHLQGVTPGLHFQPVWMDLRMVERGEACVRCGRPLEIYGAASVAQMKQLATTETQRTGPMMLTAEGRQAPIFMGRYTIALQKIMFAAAELNHDDDGIIWPVSIAPFDAIITPINYRGEMKDAAERLYSELDKAGIDALLDDREERAGVKFKDADLTGIPYRIVLGPEKLKQGTAELFERSTRTRTVLDLDSLIPTIKGRGVQPDPS